MITLEVTPDHGDLYEVTATSRDVLFWEKTTKGSKSFLDLMRDPNLVDLFRIAQIASWRQGLTSAKNLDEFEKTCEVKMKFEEGDQVPDPTQSAPSPEA